VWGYLAGAFAALDFLQPGRHTYALFTGLALAGGVGFDELALRLRARSQGVDRFDRWVLAGAVLVTVRMVGLPLVGAIHARVGVGWAWRSGGGLRGRAGDFPWWARFRSGWGTERRSSRASRRRGCAGWSIASGSTFRPVSVCFTRRAASTFRDSLIPTSAGGSAGCFPIWPGSRSSVVLISTPR